MNRAYCRFRNTLEALGECEDHMIERLEPEEERARKKLVALCKSIADDHAEDDEEES